MSFGIKVAGGTGAGCKRPLREPNLAAWSCSCGHLNPSYAVNCLAFGCREKR